MTRTKCATTLGQWKSCSSEKGFARRVDEVLRWINEEIKDVPFELLSEDEFRRIDCWAFAVAINSTTTQAIVCSELVTQIGHEFYWPTLRLVHMVIIPTISSIEVCDLIVASAKESTNFCEVNRLRLDFGALQLTVCGSICEDVPLTLAEIGTSRSTSSKCSSGTVDWSILFEALGSRDTYNADDYIPGAT
jgi:hypothetical protein